MKSAITDLSLNCFVRDNLIEIPSGEIELRDDRIKANWTVRIEAFWLAKFPVTQDLYFEVTNERPSSFKGCSLPVETVTWIQSVIFCNRLSINNGLNPCYLIQDEDEDINIDFTANGFRLPTEAEWEYSCKAGSRAIRYGELDAVAWYKENSDCETHIVGQKEPNAWGLFDMLGNVWEWCSDLYDKKRYGSYRSFRGAGFCDPERAVMATTRRRSHPLDFRIDDLGFRIAKNR